MDLIEEIIKDLEELREYLENTDKALEKRR